MVYRVYDPLKLGEQVKYKVFWIAGKKRGYFLIGKHAHYPENTVIAAMAGCNMKCVYCLWEDRWLWKGIKQRKLKMLSPEEAAQTILRKAREEGAEEIRVTGGEPTIGWPHTRDLLDILLSRADYRVVLETNGILVAVDRRIASDLAEFMRRGLVVRISIKALDPSRFRAVTLIRKDYAGLPIKAIYRLIEEGAPLDKIRVAVMISFEDPRNIAKLAQELREISRGVLNENMEFEVLLLYYETIRRIEEGYFTVKPYPYDYPWKIETAIMDPIALP